MFKRYKYDIVISVAEEDIIVAKQIAVSLRLKKIRYYLYNEQSAENWGKHIMKISLDKYGAEAKYVLVIISKIFAEKYWSGIENKIAQITTRPGNEPYILPLRLDYTPVDGISKHISFVKWENNPDEISKMISIKLQIRKRKKRKPVITLSFSVSIPALSVFFYYIFIAGNPEKPPIIESPKVMIDTGRNDTPEKQQKKVPDNRKENKQDHIKNSIVITGNITDSESGELLDGVHVNINGEEAVTKNGTFNISLSIDDQLKGSQLTINYHFSKAGYEAKNLKETITLGNITTHKTETNLNKSNQVL